MPFGCFLKSKSHLLLLVRVNLLLFELLVKIPCFLLEVIVQLFKAKINPLWEMIELFLPKLKAKNVWMEKRALFDSLRTQCARKVLEDLNYWVAKYYAFLLGFRLSTSAAQLLQHFLFTYGMCIQDRRIIIIMLLSLFHQPSSTPKKIIFAYQNMTKSPLVKHITPNTPNTTFKSIRDLWHGLKAGFSLLPSIPTTTSS